MAPSDRMRLQNFRKGQKLGNDGAGPQTAPPAARVVRHYADGLRRRRLGKGYDAELIAGDAAMIRRVAELVKG